MEHYVLQLPKGENLVFSADAVQRLLDNGDGDAALLYLFLAREGGTIQADLIEKRLRWSWERLKNAEASLSRLGLLQDMRPNADSAAPSVPEEEPPPEKSPPAYTTDDITRKLETDANFSMLLREVERRLGSLSTPSLSKLLGLYEFCGLPADVIYLLVNYCIARHERQFGEGRLPRMGEIEREGYRWARRELFSGTAANEFLRKESRKQQLFPNFMRVLQLPDRAPAPSEERFFSDWVEMGFPPETVAIAYDKTMLRCHELKWSYLNGILRRWHEKNLHTPEEVAVENAPPSRPDKREHSVGKNESKNKWMQKYIK